MVAIVLMILKKKIIFLQFSGELCPWAVVGDTQIKAVAYTVLAIVML